MRLLQLNTELSQHENALEAFLSREKFDVLTLQEVSRRTLRRFEDVFVGYFERNFYLEQEEYGVALLIRRGIQVQDIHFEQYLGGDGMTVNPYVSTKDSDYYSRGRFGVLGGRIFHEEGEFMVRTNYFPVAYPAHETNDKQRQAMTNLLSLLEQNNNSVIAGDFNIARSNNENNLVHPLYSSLGRILRDNIPDFVKNTLDPKLHRVKGLEVVCDYIWSRGNHRVSNVRLHPGLSDHQGISADIGFEK